MLCQVAGEGRGKGCLAAAQHAVCRCYPSRVSSTSLLQQEENVRAVSRSPSGAAPQLRTAAAAQGGLQEPKARAAAALRQAGTARRAFQPRAFRGDTCDMGTWKTNAQAPFGCGVQGKPPLRHLTRMGRNHSVPCSLHGF